MRKSLISVLVLAAASCFASPVFAAEMIQLDRGEAYLTGESVLPDVSRETIAAVLADRTIPSQADRADRLSMHASPSNDVSPGGATEKICAGSSGLLAGHGHGSHRDITHSEHPS